MAQTQGNVPGARTMYDSTNPFDIPQGVQMVAGYVDGLYAWSAAGWAYHAGSRHVRITVLGGTLDADAIDFETGNVTAEDAATWLVRKTARDGYATVYVQESRLGELQAAAEAAGIHAFGIWRANWNNTPDLYVNDIAHQYANPTLTGGHYDKSVVDPYWPGVDPAPAPAPPPGSVPPPVVTPPPAAGDVTGTPLDQARAAWSRLGDLLVTTAPQAVIAIEAAIAKIRALP